MRTHQEIDQRSLAIHGLVCEKIRSNPKLFDSVKTTLARWKLTVSENSQPYIAQWQNLANEGLDGMQRKELEHLIRAAVAITNHSTTQPLPTN
jgi:hypothetical protein